ncbi:flagellar motility protein MotE (MotC chaperone) [Sphingomonas sp. PvP055]|uniref:MotE family protein n=1 Tax=Sphingomonas sp. PvP055 TaxID=3156391 RepID=UPI0033921432
MIRRPSLLMLTAAAAAISTVTHAVGVASPTPEAPPTRLGTAIKQDMATRDQSTTLRNRALVLREQAARATEERIKSDLRARQQAADIVPPAGAAGATGTAGGAPVEGAQYDNLAKIYQAMKPAKAAMVFEQLDMDVQMKVAQRMRDRSTAMILASMTPKGAADLSMSLARKEARRSRDYPGIKLPKRTGL